ncbi:acyltransferase domain-containing protein [Streptomyces noursei]|uniref:acyltransferase domain-containing protein n=1 Tax=Streptomyces noursei TaxID=1971 RepID=UPI00167B8A05|nr:acyltransferase domain-containing protein [Streptomyces noursei]MCZ1021050.1 acyltransferase domain-containing protein [Streptomyces noursei]
MAQTALLFPGPGSSLPGALSDLASPDSATVRTLGTIDAVAARHGWEPFTSVLTSASPAPTSDQEHSLLWLGFFATSLALSHESREAKLEPEVLMGHSGGEITALAAAGAFSAADGARILIERVQALAASETAGGAMTVLDAAARRAAGLVAAVGDRSLALAVENGPRQSVISGGSAAIARLEAAATALGWRTRRLAMPYTLHNPQLGDATERFLGAISDLPLRGPRMPVYSPLLKKFVVSAADVREVLAVHLTRPVEFGQALQRLYDDGCDRFVECGARSVLADLVGDVLPLAAHARSLLPRRLTREEFNELAGGRYLSDTPVPSETGLPPVDTPAPATGPSQGAVHTPDTDRPQPTRAADGAEPRPGVGSLPADSEELHRQLRTVYASVLQYPEDVFTPDADLEADLGVSSIKQTEIFARLLDRFNLPTPSADTRVSAYRNLGRIAGLLRSLADDS